MGKYSRNEYAYRGVYIKISTLAEFRKAVTTYHDGRIRDSFTAELNEALENHIRLLNRKIVQKQEDAVRFKTKIGNKNMSKQQ